MSARSKIIGGTMTAVVLVLLALFATPAGLIPPLTANPTAEGGRSATAPESSPSTARSSAPSKRESSAPRSPAPSKPTSSAPRSPAPSKHDPESGLRLVDLAVMPMEARRTVLIIDRGGPFPYRRDGTTFFNRERLLPIKGSGFYREYTVPTPGESDRGARRIVTGDHDRQFFYTGDHYRTFVRIRR